MGLFGAINIFVGEDSILALYNAVWKLDGADGPPLNANGSYFKKNCIFEGIQNRDGLSWRFLI